VRLEDDFQMTTAHSVECVDLEGAMARAAPWRDLCARAIEANVFAEPAFLLNAARHLGAPALQFLFVWEDNEARRLIGMTAILPLRFGLGVASVWQSEQAGLAAIALDRDNAARAFESICEWLRRERPLLFGIFIPSQQRGGEMDRLTAAFAARQGFAGHSIDPWQRAMLLAASDESARFEQALPGKRLKEWRRLRRRLGERGPLIFRSREDATAIEAFLSLEQKNWKGRAGAPLGRDEARGAFARAMLAGLAGENKLRIDSLELSGAPIAMGVILSSQDRAFYWKTGYDEAFAEFSPGVLLTLDLSRKQQDDPKIATTDSCAIEGHPMIDRLWPDRLALVDWLVAIRPGGGIWLNAWLSNRRLVRRAKESLKPLLYRLLGRKRS
jgi:CelD/BcsL family acetyltransferase involved in cellulose biosynthesis